MSATEPETNRRQTDFHHINTSLKWHYIFNGCIIVLTLLSLCPIWMNRFLPMQDYPQHLFLSHVIATYDNPAYNWKEFYTIDLGFRPYMLWYLAMKPLSLCYGVEIAGKILFSLYILLISALVRASRRVCPRDALPWGALLLFPFAFNQIYFMGFPNYIISMPVLILAVLDLEELGAKNIYWWRVSSWRVVLHAAYLVILYLSHPYSALVYICLSMVSAMCFWGNWKTMMTVLIPAVLLGAAILSWYIVYHGPSPAPYPYVWHVSWLPVEQLVLFYTIILSGMRFTNGPDWFALAVWIAVLTAIFNFRQRSHDMLYNLKLPVSLFAISAAGYMVLPFWFGYYSFFNLRLAPISCFLFAVLLAHIHIKPKIGIFISTSSAILLIITSSAQSNISKDTENILPLFQYMEKNSLVLPLLFNTGSTILEPVDYHEFHINEFNYYHVLVGGGANPALFRNAMIPVQYRSGVQLPFPEKPSTFSWQKHGFCYKYILLREAPVEFSRQMHVHCFLIAKSGSWELYKNRDMGLTQEKQAIHE